jgi:D-erythronate 2-dehydrogenase
MVEALEAVGGKEASSLIDWRPDAFIQRIVLTWPPNFVTNRAEELGFVRDESVQEIVAAFVEEELAGRTLKETS